MPKYYCDYCDTFLTHDSPSVRKTHNGGRKHKENVRMFYQKWMEDQAQKLVDATAKAFAGGKPPGKAGPPPSMPMMGGRPPLMGPPMHGMRPMPFGFPGAIPPFVPMGPMGMPPIGGPIRRTPMPYRGGAPPQ